MSCCQYCALAVSLCVPLVCTLQLSGNVDSKLKDGCAVWIHLSRQCLLCLSLELLHLVACFHCQASIMGLVGPIAISFNGRLHMFA